MVVQDKAAQRVFHHEAGEVQQGLHLAEAVGLIVALIQVVPAFACSTSSMLLDLSTCKCISLV